MLTFSLGAGVALPASAATATFRTSNVAVSTSVAGAATSAVQGQATGLSTVSGSTSSLPGQGPVRTGNGQTVSPDAIWIRIAVKAAMAALKKTSKSWYNAIISKVKAGKTAFVNWWNKSVPSWVKNLFGGVSAAAIYDAVRWIIGL